ncbi:hypothetical protein [uncultured Microbacterium sp.]|uniref:hypothetical protein n=1 Tax=uncultured Microbacterium sp. TaxID=191216 RepID=UPI002607DA99|nr:hypothetical protein [uncultured Microbacterium sp.]
MTFSIIGIVFLALGILGWIFSERLFIVILAASAAFTTSAAVTVGGYSVSPFHVVGVLAVISAIVSRFRGVGPGHTAATLLMCALGWSALVTAIGPSLFRGMPILEPKGGIDRQVFDPTPLAYTPSMAAQLAYLTIGVGVAVYLAQRQELRPSLATIPIALGTFLSALALLPGGGETIGALFRNSASAWYNAYEARLSGIFAEPSFLGVFSVMALAFALFRVAPAKGFEKLVLIGVILIAPITLLASGSAVGAVALVILVATAIVYYGARFIFARMKLHPAWLLVPFTLVFALATPNTLTGTLTSVITGKTDTESFRNRFASDFFSIDLTAQTYGFGVGLGASRPSSFATLVISNVGVVGFALLASAIVLALVRARRSPQWVAVPVALFALVLAKVIAEPALSTPMMWLLLGMCMYAGRTVPGSPAVIGVDRAESVARPPKNTARRNEAVGRVT